MNEDLMDYLTVLIVAAALLLGLLHWFDILFY
jgi:hypothetical protein